MKKRIFAVLLTVCLLVGLLPTVAMADDTSLGSIEKITDVAVVSGDTISVSGSTLSWYQADASIGRWQDGWWVGFKIVAPRP